MQIKKLPIKVFLLVILLSITLFGCSKRNTNQATEGIDDFFAFEDVNQTIKLSLFSYCPDGKLEINHTFCYLVTNDSQDKIVFPPTLNLRLYMFSEVNESWIEIQDSFNVSGNDIVLNPKGEEFWDVVNSVHPLVPPSKTPVKLRIIVVGQVDGGDERQVGAFLDVILQPEGGSSTGLTYSKHSWLH